MHIAGNCARSASLMRAATQQRTTTRQEGVLFYRCTSGKGNNAPDAVASRRREEDGREAAAQVLTTAVYAASSVVEGVPRLKRFVQHGRHREARAHDVSEQRAHLLRQAARNNKQKRRV
jgi:hypothetical protein